VYPPARTECRAPSSMPPPPSVCPPPRTKCRGPSPTSPPPSVCPPPRTKCRGPPATRLRPVAAQALMVFTGVWWMQTKRQAPDRVLQYAEGAWSEYAPPDPRKNRRPIGVNPDRSLEQRTLGPSTHPVSEGGSTRRSVQMGEYLEAFPRRTIRLAVLTLANAPCVHSGRPESETESHPLLLFETSAGTFQNKGRRRANPLRGIGWLWWVDGRLRGCTGNDQGRDRHPPV